VTELMRRAAPGAALAGLALTTVWLLDPGLHADPQPTALPATSDSSAGATDTGSDDATADTGSQDSTTDTDTGTSDSSGSGSTDSDAVTTPEGDSSSASSDCSDTTSATGDSAMTRWGPVQVQVEFAADGSVCSVQAIAYPESDPKSAHINSYAIPSLDAQASEVGISFDAVSGATYTSEAYRESLQSALDRR